MRRAIRFGLAAAVGLAAASAATAQTTGTASTGGTTATATSSGAAGGTSSGLATTTPGLSSGATQQTTASISGTAIGQTTNPSGVDPSNNLGAFYANPNFSGAAGSTENTAPGGFGVPLYGTSSGTGSVRTGSASSVGTSTNSTRASGGNATTAGGTTAARTGTTGTTGRGMTGTTSLGGASSQQAITNVLGTAANTLANPVGGQIVPLPRAIAYQADMRFTYPVQTPAIVQMNLQTVLNSSSQLSSPGGLQVTAETGGAVVLRGSVRTEEEARLAEGMLRLTPGVRDVKNELTYPTP